MNDTNQEKANHRITITVGGRQVETLEDILPSNPGLRALFIAKTPAPVSVRAGHYFQGKQGKMLWNKLATYQVLNVPYGEFEDDHLLANDFGITDIVKVPRDYGNEPSADEYREGLPRILELIATHTPQVVIFVYKGVLDNILKLAFRRRIKSSYGFNDELESLFKSRVFVFPMPGTGKVTKEIIHRSMTELSAFLAR